MFSVRWSSFLVVSAVLASIGATRQVHERARASVRAAPGSRPVIIDDARAPELLTQDALSLISLSGVSAYATGSGVHVAVLDGGFDLGHEFLAGHLGDGWDAVDEDSDPQDIGNSVDDDSDEVTDSCVGHGTFVAGLIAICAPDAVLHPIRVLDDEGCGSAAALARGIDKAVDLGCDVINMSLVATEMTSQLEASIYAANLAGVVIVSSAGNDPDGPFDASYLLDRSITVGAVDGDLAVASFSPNQSLVDIFAPGVDVLGPLGGADEDSYASWSGTSFSCAFVSAAAALVKEDHPNLGFLGMKNRLANSSNTVTGASPSNRGSVDLLDAVQD